MNSASAPLSATTPAAHPWSVSNRWWALAVISLATLMVGMDTAIVAVALPSAQRELGIPDTARQWVLTAYTLAYGGLLLLGGRLADRLGHRRTLLIGAIGFVCASALSGAALSGPMLFAGRALQGAFGALLVPSTRSLLVLIFDDAEERARALGIFTAVLIGGAILGFILSGLITNYLDWRWTLYLNVPVAVVVALGVLRFLPEFPGDASIRVDVPGVVLGSGGMVVLVYGLSEAASAGWGSTEVAVLLAAAAALLLAFVFVERQVRGPLLPLRVLTDRNRAGSFIALGLNSFANFGMLLVLTYELQVVLQASPLLTGAALVPWAIVSSLGAAVIGPRLMRRYPARYLMTPGLLLLSGGLLLLAQLTPQTGYAPLILVAELVMGFGAGLNGTPAIYTALSGTPPGRHRRDLGHVEHLEPDRRLDRHGGAEHDRRQRDRVLPSGTPRRGEHNRAGERLCGGDGRGRRRVAGRRTAGWGSRQCRPTPTTGALSRCRYRLLSGSIRRTLEVEQMIGRDHRDRPEWPVPA